MIEEEIVSANEEEENTEAIKMNNFSIVLSVVLITIVMAVLFFQIMFN